MVIFAGPFVGEFGWELSYWHAWLRNLKKNYYSNDTMIVSSYPGRECLYDFADGYIPLSDKFISKNYSQRAFFLDYDIQTIPMLKKDLLELYDYIFKLLPENDIFHISCYPQKIHSTKIYYRIIKKLFNTKKNNKNILNKNLDSVNKYAGQKIKEPFHLNFPYKVNKYYPQYPEIKDQNFEILKSTNIAIETSKKIIDKYKKKNVFTIFPRKRNLRRSDKNWGKENWEIFINLLLKNYNPLIIICGTKNGSYFTDSVNDSNIYNSIDNEYNIANTDYQISLIKDSNVSIHSLSGSAILSLLCKKKTFMYGDTKSYKSIYNDGNPLNTDLFYYIDESLKPKPNEFFEEFRKFYER